jgi:serine/threonine protein kinase
MELAFQIAKLFKIDSEVKFISPIQSGHINDTYLVNSISGMKYVLQKLNGNVFKDIHGLIDNKILVSEHLFKSDSIYETIQFIKTSQDQYSILDDHNDHWMLMNFIQDSVVYHVASNKEMVFEAGKLYGDFIYRTSNLDTDKLIETIIDFHSVPFRYRQFEMALAQASHESIGLANAEIDLVLNSRKEMYQLSELKAKNYFPTRVTHNDAKLSNILFDKNGKGLAVIDLDTVMPGIAAFDFGDSIRSICATTREDDSNLESTNINLEFYKSYCIGFAENTKCLLSSEEIQYLPLGAKTITFIMGLRFLTDHLNGNVYYKSDYETHNLVRAKNQFKLVRSIQDHYKSMQNITAQSFK